MRHPPDTSSWSSPSPTSAPSSRFSRTQRKTTRSRDARAIGAIRVDQRHLREANEKLLLSAIREQEIADELRTMATFREQLLGIIGHDLRSPLAAIRLSMEAVMRDEGLSLAPKALTLMKEVRDTTRRMDTLISQLLDFTRAHRTGGFLIAPRATNLRQICEPVIAELERGYSRKGQFRCRYDEDLDGNWDADRLAQVVSNLGENAIKYGARNSPIVLRARDTGNTVILQLTNRGKPIPSEQLPLLFEPFQRVKRNTMTNDGLGFGLYIAQEIVRSHGGSIAVHSTAAEGTTFSISLPRSQQEGKKEPIKTVVFRQDRLGRKRRAKHH